MAIVEVSVTQLLVAMAVICVAYLIIKKRNLASRLPPGTRLPPCLPTVPVLGSIPFLPTEFVKIPRHYVEQAKKYGSVFAVYMGTTYSVVLNDMDSVREALVRKASHFSDRSQTVTFATLLSEEKGVSLINYTNELRHKRKLYLSILKKFGFGSRNMETRINAEVTEFIKQMQLIGGNSIDPDAILRLCLVNNITSLLFGRRYPYGHAVLTEFCDYSRDLMNNIPQAAELFPFLQFFPPISGQIKTLKKLTSHSHMFMDREPRSNLDLSYMADICLKLILCDESAIGNINKNAIIVQAFICQINASLKDAVDTQGESFVKEFVELTSTDLQQSSLIDANFDREELIQTLRELLVGGIDTTATTLQWLLIHLANNPDVQIRLQKEVDDVVGGDRMCSLDDEVNMPYTQAFILEVLRLRPVLPMSVFHATACDTTLGNYFIPAKTTVIINLYGVNIDSSKWNEPESFKPERFIDEHGKLTGKERVISFSMGKRTCLGEVLARQTIFLFLAGILQNFDVRPPDGQSKVKFEEILTMVWKPDKFQVRIISRKH